MTIHYSSVLEKSPFQQLETKKLSHDNRVEINPTSLSLMIKPASNEIIFISLLHPIKSSGLCLDNTTNPSVTHYNQATNTIDGWIQGDRNVALGSLYSSPDAQREEPGRVVTVLRSPRWTYMDPSEENVSQGSRQRCFDNFIQDNILDSITGIYYSTNSISPWHIETLSKNHGCRVKMKTLGTKNN